MTKTTQATIFRKRQILPARGLNKALQEYGSVDGVVPFKADGTQDTSMTAPLGTKAAPFGNAHFKGFNLYTQLEVQQMVENGVLGSADRFVFWNLDTNNLSAWNGTEIIHLGGNGGGDSMDYLFGDGSDGDVTMVSDGVYDTVKNFTNFTLNAGVTLSKSISGSPLVLRCTGTCTLNGIINLDGKGFHGGSDSYGYGYGFCSGSSGTQFPAISGIGQSNRYASGSVDLNMIKFLASALELSNIPWCGGGGGGAYSNLTNSNHTTRAHGGGIGCASGGSGVARNVYSGTAVANGGNGGAGLCIIARKINNNATILSRGTPGTTAGRTSSSASSSAAVIGGGGAGGLGVFITTEMIDNGTYDFSGAPAALANVGQPGGNGGYVIVVI